MGSSHPPHQQQVPIITPHAPQLPAGPGLPLSLPLPLHPLAAAPPFPTADVPMPVSAFPHPALHPAFQEKEQQSLYQQQQLLMALAQHQQGQPINPAFIPHGMLQPHHGGLSVDPSQPGVVFQFPTVEEMARAQQQQQQQHQKLAAASHMAGPETFAMVPHHLHALPSLEAATAAAQAAASVRQQEEQQRLPPHLHPSVMPSAGFSPMELLAAHHPALVAQHHQQQVLQQQGMRGVAAALPDNADLRRYYEQLAQEIQKDPTNHQLQMQLIMLQAAEQQQHQLQLQEMIIHQELLKQQQQQQQQQQKYPPPALRPGVIMNMQPK